MDVFSDSYRQHKVPVKNRWNPLNYIPGFIDSFAIFIAFQCSYFINSAGKSGFFYSELNLLHIFIGILPFWLLILYLIKATGVPTKRYKVLLFLYIQSAIAIYFLLIIFYYFFGFLPVSRLFLIEFSFFGFLFLFLARILSYKAYRMYGEKGHHHVNTILIADESSIPYIDNIIANKKLGYRIVVIFTESDLVKGKYENIAIVLPEKFIGIIKDLIEVDFIDEVLYLKEKINALGIREIVGSCEDMGITLRIRFNDSKVSLSSAVKSDIADGKFLSFKNISNNTFALAIKKTGDINMALLLIIVLTPVLVIIGLIIKLTSRGPVLARISSVGWRGREIELYRFRTLKASSKKEINESAEEVIDISFTDLNEDYPFTRVGRFLHKSGLDQLPELFNILKGEISITGPRHPLNNKKLNNK